MTEREKKMMVRFWTTAMRIESERLPGWGAFLDGDEKANRYLTQREQVILDTYRDEDEILFGQAVEAWEKVWERVNERLAERYRKENKDPDLWELRYIKWMKITYIHFTSEKGDFYLLPRRPRKKPRVEHWYTVDEMLDMLHPTIAAALTMSDVLPPRPGSLKGPSRGEKYLVVDCTGPEMKVHYQLPKGGLNG